MQPTRFATLLIHWWNDHKRNLPWKQTSDPYRVWVSEIILQQTRVKQGIKYYARFLEAFPDIASLAKASEESVLKAWEGLGYYNRARNMQVTAKHILQKYGGQFPDEYAQILALKGIGPYTAAAIASFSFGKPYAVVDGNVLRIASRILGIEKDISGKTTVDQIQDFVGNAIQHALPADFNQAIMDFGSLVCVPARPACETCIMSEYCVAYQLGKTADIPFKKKKQPLKNRYFHFFDLHLPDNKTILVQRSTGDIWARLFTLPVIETQDALMPGEVERREMLISMFEDGFAGAARIETLGKSSQVLSHQKIHGFFYKLTLNQLNIVKKNDLYLVEREKVSKFAFPKIISTYLWETGRKED
jgi:A/G-specific adenine glycosylase